MKRIAVKLLIAFMIFASLQVKAQSYEEHGFVKLAEAVDHTEWWHFTLGNEPFHKTYFNFLIK